MTWSISSYNNDHTIINNSGIIRNQALVWDDEIWYGSWPSALFSLWINVWRKMLKPHSFCYQCSVCVCIRAWVHVYIHTGFSFLLLFCMLTTGSNSSLSSKGKEKTINWETKGNHQIIHWNQGSQLRHTYLGIAWKIPLHFQSTARWEMGPGQSYLQKLCLGIQTNKHHWQSPDLKTNRTGQH